jgi:hypothetical protein
MNKSVSIRTLIFWTAIVLAVFFFLKSCGSGILGGLFGGGKADTISVRHDTVWVVTQGDTIYKPIPFSVTNTIYKPLYKTDTLEITEVLPTDTAAILSHFYQKVFYSDTQVNKYGKIIIDDTVFKNRIASRRVITDLKIPEVTNTITLKQKRNVVYLGVGAMSSLEDFIYAVGGDVSLKTKTDKIYSVGAFATKEGKLYYQLGFKVPIHLIKQK